MTRNKFILSAAAGGLIATVAVFAWAQQSDGVLRFEQPVSSDLYAAKRDVEILATVTGDVVAAGRRVVLDGEITGDVIAAAQDVEIRGAVRDDVRAVGQHVRIMAPVTGHIVATGQTVTVDEDVGDWASLAGRTVTVEGRVGGDLKIAAKSANINSEIDGNVEVIGENLSLGPDAVVRGNVRWRSKNEADISPDAQIDGEFIEEPLPEFVDEVDKSRGVIFTVGLIIAVTTLFLLFSGPLRSSAERIATRPGVSLALGFAVLVSTPILALILLITRFGAWLGLTILGVYLALLVIGVLTGLFTVGDVALRRLRSDPTNWHVVAAIAVAVIAVGLLRQVPYVGGFVVFLVLLAGTGSVSWLSWQALRSKRDDVLR